jgi:hypothetical protein
LAAFAFNPSSFVSLHKFQRPWLSGLGRDTTLVALLAIGLGRLAADDSAAVTSFDVFKLQFYSQTSTAQPTSPISFQFNARIFVSSSLCEATSNLSTPSSGCYDLGSSGTVFQNPVSFGSAAEMDAQFDTGCYQFSLQSADLGGGSTQTGTLTMPASFYSCSVPYFTNYTSLQSIDPNQNTTLAWNTFTTNPSAPLSQIFLVIRDTTRSNVVVDQFFESSSTTSFNVLSGTLVAGDSYSATLYFSSRSSFPGAWNDGAADGLVAFDQATIMSFTAIPEPSAYVAIMSVTVLGGALLLRRRASCSEAGG